MKYRIVSVYDGPKKMYSVGMTPGGNYFLARLPNLTTLEGPKKIMEHHYDKLLDCGCPIASRT